MNAHGTLSPAWRTPDNAQSGEEDRLARALQADVDRVAAVDGLREQRVAALRRARVASTGSAAFASSSSAK